MYANPHAGMGPGRQPQPYQQQFMQPNQPVERFVLTQTPQGPMYYDQMTGQYYTPQFMQQQQQQMMQQQAAFAQRPMMQPGFQPTFNQAGMFPQAGVQVTTAIRETGMSTLPDNRFNTVSRETYTPQPVQSEKPDMRVPVNASTLSDLVKQAPPVKTKLLMSPAKTTKIQVRQHPFVEAETENVELIVVGSGFTPAVSELYDLSAGGEVGKNKTLIIGKCLIQEPFYETSLVGKEEIIFNTDPEVVYRQLRDVVANVDIRPDIVFLTEYNKWLTDHVNDLLAIYAPPNSKIDSFIEDFNDLKKILGDIRTDNPSLGTVYNEVCRELRAILLNCQNGAWKPSDDKDSPSSMTLVDDVFIVYAKMLSTELWKDGIPDESRTGNRLISSMLPYIEGKVFYISTMDKVIYKVHVTTRYEVLVQRLD